MGPDDDVWDPLRPSDGDVSRPARSSYITSCLVLMLVLVATTRQPTTTRGGRRGGCQRGISGGREDVGYEARGVDEAERGSGRPHHGELFFGVGVGVRASNIRGERARPLHALKILIFQPHFSTFNELKTE